jgi:predicted Fe-Mo cluster-binding NifX family protein
VIHYEPQSRTHTRITIPLADREGSISDHFGTSPFFAFVVVRLEDAKEEKRAVIENPHREVDVAKGIRVAEWLVAQNVDHVVMREDMSRKGPGYVLANAGIKSNITSANILEKAIEEALLAYRTKERESIREHESWDRGGHVFYEER